LKISKTLKIAAEGSKKIRVIRVIRVPVPIRVIRVQTSVLYAARKKQPACHQWMGHF
jgi:hypothetical protein